MAYYILPHGTSVCGILSLGSVGGNLWPYPHPPTIGPLPHPNNDGRKGETRAKCTTRRTETFIGGSSRGKALIG